MYSSSKVVYNQVPIISGTPFFSITARANSSTLLFKLWNAKEETQTMSMDACRRTSDFVKKKKIKLYKYTQKHRYIHSCSQPICLFITATFNYDKHLRFRCKQYGKQVLRNIDKVQSTDWGGAENLVLNFKHVFYLSLTNKAFNISRSVLQAILFFFDMLGHFYPSFFSKTSRWKH